MSKADRKKPLSYLTDNVEISYSDALGAVATLVAFSVSIPTLSTLGNGPAFFVAHGLHTAVIALIVLFIIVAPLIALLTPITLAWCVAGQSIRLLAVTTVISGLTALLVLQILPQDLLFQVLISLSIIAGLLIALLYVRYKFLRRILRDFGPVILFITAAWFFFLSPSSAFFSFGYGENEYVSSVENPVPITIVVFDEFHTTAILDQNGKIDDVRFPNFGQLAKDGIWYPNALANTDSTVRAIPTILTGNYVSVQNARPPSASGYPENLLNTLSNVYDISTIEPITQLCPSQACSPSNQHNVKGLVDDIRLITYRSILPSFLVGDLPTLDGRWSNFGNGGGEPGPEEVQNASGTNFEHVLASLSERPRTQLNFYHFIVPHLPYERLSDGRMYQGDDLFPPGIIDEDGGWVGDTSLIETAYHRYLHQVGYADMLLGQVIQSLKDAGLYDEGILVVTADHGVAFVGGQSRRSASLNNNVREIHHVPFFIKPPLSSSFSDPGGVRVVSVSHLDLVPTLAQLIGAKLPLKVQGDSVFDLPTKGTRGIRLRDSRLIYSEKDVQGFDRLSWQVDRFGEHTSLATLTRIDGMHGDMIGKPVSLFKIIDIEPNQRMVVSLGAGPVGAWAMRNTFKAFLPARVEGTINAAGEGDDPLLIVLALNGVVQAITNTSIWNGRKGYFEAMLPPDGFRVSGNRLDVYIADTSDPGTVRLMPTQLPQNALAVLAFKMQNGIHTELIERGTREWIIRKGHGAIDGVKTEGSTIALNGWAASENFEAPQSLVVFSGKNNLPTSIRFWPRPEVNDHLKTLGAQACEDCNYGWVLTLSEEQLADMSGALRIFALYTDSLATELTGSKLLELNERNARTSQKFEADHVDHNVHQRQ